MGSHVAPGQILPRYCPHCAWQDGWSAFFSSDVYDHTIDERTAAKNTSATPASFSSFTIYLILLT